MNHSKITRFLAMFLAVVMVIGYMPVSAFATETSEEDATPATATVSFDVNGGIGEYEDQVVIIGEKVTKPEQDPTHESLEFAYWTADTEENVEWNFEENAVEGDMTLYAAWTEPVIPETNEGSDEVEDETTTEGGDETTTEGGDETTTEGGDETTAEGGDEATTEGGDETTTEGGDETATEGGDETTTEGGDEVLPVVYTANYYKWDWDLEADVLIESEELTGIPGELTNVQAKEYEGLILMDEIVQVEIAADGSTVVDVFYIVELDSSVFLSSELYDTTVSGDYFKVLDEKVYDLAPGAQEYGFVLNNADGTDRKAVHVFAVDTKNEDIQVLPGYYAIDKLDPDNLPLEGIVDKSEYWKAMELTKTVKYYEDMGYNVVGAMNTALAYDSNAPYGYMVWNGVVLGTPEVHKGAQTYLAIDKNGNCELRSMSTPLTGNEQTAISANFGWLVKDGKLTSTSVERTSSDASRSMIGIKADGTLIFCHVDGRDAPTSTGLSNYEMGEMMLALGCVNAVNCDGGGSSTFISKRAGESVNTMRSKPSDGAERPTINSVILVSTAGATGIFDKVLFESEHEYIAPGASMAITTIGQDTKQFTMDIPAGVTYQVAEEGMGTIENGVYTAGTVTGTATIQAVYNGNIVGEMKLNVVDPDEFRFSVDETVLPYGKTMELEIVATYGDDNWSVCVDGAYTLTLSDEAAASLEGNTLISVVDEAVKGVDVVATYIPDTAVTAKLKVSYGKGSEILFNFEDGDASMFKGVDEMYDWAKENGASAPIQSNSNYSEDADSETFLATRTNGGQVRNGDYALGVTLDYTDAQFASWSYNMFFYTGEEEIVLRDVANGMNATTFGMWVYIPEGAAGLAMQMQGFQNPDGTGGTGGHFYFTTASGVKKNLNSCSEADIPESRWVYATCDLTQFGDFFATYDPYGTNGREPSFIRFYVKPTTAANLTFYFDDFTLDYSSAVDDRVLPTITNVCYATQDTAVGLGNNITITGNTVTFSANVADNQGLNSASGKILVDGIAVGTSVSGTVMSSAAVTLTSGVHTVSYEIQDKLGNLARVTRTFTISGDAAITLTGHNDSGELAEYGSTYYIDLKTADIASLNGVTATLKLQSANTWETAGITAAPGFKVSNVSVNAHSNELTITVARDGAAVAAFEGETTLVSIPVRMWSWNGVNHVTDTPIAPGTQFKTGYCPVVNVDCQVVYGKADYISGAFGAFGGKYTAATKINDNIYPWHYHDSELAVKEMAPTCTEAGYTGRTYCETCKSVIGWGTTVPAKDHTFKVVGDQLVCDCGAILGGNGLVTAGDKIYVLIADHLVTGWQNVDSKWVYAAVSTKEVQTGEFTVNKLTYTADEEGFVIKGAWVTDENGTKYSYGPKFHTREWVDIDGKTYYFGTDSYIYTGIQYIPVNRNNMKEGIIWYEFAEDGVYVGKVNGFVYYNNLKYYVVDGVFTYGGLMHLDTDGDNVPDAYFYARTSGEIVCGRRYWITKNNDILPCATYTFDEEGKMIDPPVTEEPEQPNPEQPDPEQPAVKNGICADESGKLWYYVNNVKTYGGLMHLDTDGDGEADAYYYARTSGEIVVNRKYTITKNNDLLPVAGYTFGADGKMIDPPITEKPEQPDPEQPVVKNGVCADENGKLWYYINDVKTYGGLLHLDTDGDGEADAYYYARTSGEIVVNRKYTITKNNDLLPVAGYTFGADGKMIDPPITEKPEQPDPEQPVVKNGVCADENGKLWYYVNDVKTYGGLLHLDTDGDGVKDAYYYARSSGEIVCGKAYSITKHNDLLPLNRYTFDADGKMIDPPVTEEPEQPDPEQPDPEQPVVKNGVCADENGKLWYYVNDVKTYGGLLHLDTDGDGVKDAYYYARSSGEIVCGKAYYISKSNDLLPLSRYTFDADGKMIDPPVQK